jgi:hypothetical protein
VDTAPQAQWFAAQWFQAVPTLEKQSLRRKGKEDPIRKQGRTQNLKLKLPPAETLRVGRANLKDLHHSKPPAIL